MRASSNPGNDRRMNRHGLLQLAAALALSFAAFSASALKPAPPAYAPYLDCAASRANYAFLLRKSKYKDGGDIKKVEDNAQAYLRIAVSLAGRELDEELKTSAAKVQTSEEGIMNTRGADAYLQHAAETEQACAALVEKNKPALLEAMEKYEARQAQP